GGRGGPRQALPAAHRAAQHHRAARAGPHRADRRPRRRPHPTPRPLGALTTPASRAATTHHAEVLITAPANAESSSPSRTGRTDHPVLGDRLDRRPAYRRPHDSSGAAAISA